MTIEQAQKFASDNDLIFIGETSVKDNINCTKLFNILIEKVHSTQTSLVKQGIKSIEDLRYGEEERTMNYHRCCY